MRTFLWTLLAAALFFATPLLATVATAYSDGTHFYLENDVLEIAVLQTNGSLDGIIHKQSGVNLQSRNVGNYQGIWGMSLNTPNGVIPFVGNVNTTNFGGTTTTTANGATLSLTWQGLLPAGTPALSNVTVKAQISVQADSQFSYWTFEVDGLGANSVISITYPCIPGIGQLGQSGDDDVLLTSEFKGMLYHNPTSTVPAGSYPGGSYPSAGGLIQLLAFLDNTSGFYFATDDVHGNTKDYYWGKSSSPAGDFTISVVYYPPGLPADTVSVPYNAIVGATQGDWYSAADMYRAWAVQRWTQQSQTKNVPAWLHDLPLIRNTCAHVCGVQPDQSYAQVVQDWQQSQQSLGVPALGELFGWEKYGTWAYGDYFPPREGWSSFDAMVQANPSGKLGVYPSALYLDTDTSLYQSGAMAASSVAPASDNSSSPCLPKSAPMPIRSPRPCGRRKPAGVRDREPCTTMRQAHPR